MIGCTSSVLGECTTGANHVHERHSNAAIHVQNQVCSLASGNLFHFQGIVQHWCGFKVLLRKSLDDFHSLVRVCQGLDPVSDAHDQLVALLHLLNPVLGCNTAALCISKHFGSIIQCATKARTNGQQATAQRRDEILAFRRVAAGRLQVSLSYLETI